MPGKVKIRQIKSTIGRNVKQKKTIRALGIRRMHQEVVLEGTPQVRGMITKVLHLLKVEELGE
jgi:large subunit ribosomal protein L30